MNSIFSRGQWVCIGTVGEQVKRTLSVCCYSVTVALYAAGSVPETPRADAKKTQVACRPERMPQKA